MKINSIRLDKWSYKDIKNKLKTYDYTIKKRKWRY